VTTVVLGRTCSKVRETAISLTGSGPTFADNRGGMERSSYGSRIRLLWRRSAVLAADSAGVVGAVADVPTHKAVPQKDSPSQKVRLG
jgi:hypothetical protein